MLCFPEPGIRILETDTTHALKDFTAGSNTLENVDVLEIMIEGQLKPGSQWAMHFGLLNFLRAPLELRIVAYRDTFNDAMAWAPVHLKDAFLRFFRYRERNTQNPALKFVNFGTTSES